MCKWYITPIDLFIYVYIFEISVCSRCLSLLKIGKLSFNDAQSHSIVIVAKTNKNKNQTELTHLDRHISIIPTHLFLFKLHFNHFIIPYQIDFEIKYFFSSTKFY